mmetsp:Transcript_13047/g.20333  ORF Transcript_13047/g.20333 Transcript_13047/m.20333 type:complete len:299 (-) Transcript_13047:695-1591(-)
MVDSYFLKCTCKALPNTNSISDADIPPPPVVVAAVGTGIDAVLEDDGATTEGAGIAPVSRFKMAILPSAEGIGMGGILFLVLPPPPPPLDCFPFLGFGDRLRGEVFFLVFFLVSSLTGTTLVEFGFAFRVVATAAATAVGGDVLEEEVPPPPPPPPPLLLLNNSIGDKNPDPVRLIPESASGKGGTGGNPGGGTGFTTFGVGGGGGGKDSSEGYGKDVSSTFGVVVVPLDTIDPNQLANGLEEDSSSSVVVVVVVVSPLAVVVGGGKYAASSGGVSSSSSSSSYSSKSAYSTVVSPLP